MVWSRQLQSLQHLREKLKLLEKATRKTSFLHAFLLIHQTPGEETRDQKGGEKDGERRTEWDGMWKEVLCHSDIHIK